MSARSSCECGSSLPRPPRFCHCEGCHESFTGVKAFDAHRRGRHGVDRHCATPAQMLILGLRKNAQGQWSCPAGVKRGRISEMTNEPRPAA
jgi:hypothetical protein